MEGRPPPGPTYTHCPRPGEVGARDPPQRSPCICHPWKCADPLGNASGNGGSRAGTRPTAGVGPLAPPAALQGVGQHQLGESGPLPGRKGLISPSTAPPPHHGTGMLFPMGVMGKLRQLKGKRDTPKSPWGTGGAAGSIGGGGGGCQKPTVNEGLRAGGRTPMAWGAQHWGPSPYQCCLPAPHPIPSTTGGTSPDWGGGEATPPTPNTPHCPTPPSTPCSHRHWGHRAGGCPEPAPRCQHPPLQPRTHHRPGWGGTGNQVLLVKLGAPVRAPPHPAQPGRKIQVS